MGFRLPRLCNLSSAAITPHCLPAGRRAGGFKHRWEKQSLMCPLHVPNGKPWLLPVFIDSMCACSEPQVWLRVNHLVTQKTLIRHAAKHLHIFSKKFAFTTFIYLHFVQTYLLDIGHHIQILLFVLCLVCIVCKIVAFDQ